MSYKLHQLASAAAKMIAVLAILGAAPAAWAACRVTDFSDRPLSSLTEEQRLAFASQLTQTEFARFKSVASGDPNHYSLIANAASVSDVHTEARAKFEALGLEFSDDIRRLYATNYLTDQQIAKFANCVSARQPGLLALGRNERPDLFHLTFVHITPIGIEKIYTQLVASSNVANVAEFEAFLAELGPQDNYTAKLFPLKLINPAKRTVVVMRAGWETPRYVVVPPTAK